MNITQQVVKLEKEKLDRKLAKAWDNADFRNGISTLKRYIAEGYSLDEARRKFSPMSEAKWDLKLHALGSMTYTAGKIFAEHYVKAQTRLSLTIDLYNRAKKAGDLRTELTAIMTMVKIDESLLTWAQSLGVIKPEEKPVDGGFGIDNTDLKNEYARVEQEITDRLRDEERSRHTIPVALLTQSEPDGSTDQVGPSAVDVQSIK